MSRAPAIWENRLVQSRPLRVDPFSASGHMADQRRGAPRRYQSGRPVLRALAASQLQGISGGTKHGARFVFSTFGERDLEFAKSEAKLMLDHMEGADQKK
jgi:hypothetical protein